MCGEDWDYVGAANGDMEPWQYELFMQGAGCPGCKGDPEVLFEPETIDDIEYGDRDPAIRINQLDMRDSNELPKWEEPPPPEPVRGCVYEAADAHEIMYLDVDEDELKKYSSFSYGKLHNDKVSWRNNVEVIVPRYTSGSDYSGCSVERSNYNTIEKEFGERDDVFTLYDGYGTYAIAILASCDCKELAETIESLHDYPVIDEDDLRELETELKYEAWDNWAREEFNRTICKRFNFDKLEIDNGDLYDLFYSAKEDANEYWEIESGCEAYIRLNNVVKSIDFEIMSNITRDPYELEIVLFVNNEYYPCEVKGFVTVNNDELSDRHEAIVLSNHVYRL
jgi:hypothetical protein